MSDRRLEYMPLEAIPPAPVNPKAHDLGQLHTSVGRFGFTEPMLLDERTGRLVAGHGRLETLQQMKAQGQAPPDGVVVAPDGTWQAPVIRGWASKSDADASAYLLASNRLVELGAWHDAALADLLKELAAQDALEGTGFDADDLDELLKGIGAAPGLTDPDEVPEPPAEAECYVKPGDLWGLGGHRLLCGDSTKADDVDRLLGGAKPSLMVTDPPYGVEYDPEWRVTSGLNERGRTGKVTNDDRADWSETYRLFPGDVAYIWHADRTAVEVGASVLASGFLIRSRIIWAKQRFVLTRGHYHPQHETCWYAVRDGGTAGWVGDHSQSTLWQVSDRNEDSDTNHGTQKPVELMARAIRNHSGEVYEPFSGSGTTLVAAEQLGRRCYAIEIEPRYVQVAIERWQKFTGKMAARLSGIGV